MDALTSVARGQVHGRHLLALAVAAAGVERALPITVEWDALDVKEERPICEAKIA